MQKHSWDWGFDSCMFKDRQDAGRKLGLKIKGVIEGSFETSLKRHSGKRGMSASRIMLRDSGQARMTKDKDYSVVGIVRGGVVLAKIIAGSLNTSLHALVIRKIGAPYNRELAIGAVGHNTIVYWDEDLIKRFNIDNKYRQQAIKEKAQEVENLEKIFSVNKKGMDFIDKRVILVDDGVATGATVLCAQKIIKLEKPKELILATPVISKDSFEAIKRYFDRIIVAKIAERFSAVGEFYKDFPQVENQEVIKILNIK